ncbi:unnamed protein product [Trichogramma brassicae]|uniref:Uncharacterized protein n=1 Tax=Trichogramma brassicae TaxID=86971 RepID=A0A6H5II56_9HYME|nr:unnamed protein product [Trichogramma brassicae]
MFQADLCKCLGCISLHSATPKGVSRSVSPATKSLPTRRNALSVMLSFSATAQRIAGCSRARLPFTICARETARELDSVARRFIRVYIVAFLCIHRTTTDRCKTARVGESGKKCPRTYAAAALHDRASLLKKRMQTYEAKVETWRQHVDAQLVTKSRCLFKYSSHSLFTLGDTGARPRHVYSEGSLRELTIREKEGGGIRETGIHGGRDLFLFSPIVRRESRECSTIIRTPQCSARCAAEPRGVESKLGMPQNTQMSTVGRSSTASDKRKEDKSIEISRQSLVTPPPLAFYLQSMVSEFPPLDA